MTDTIFETKRKMELKNSANKKYVLSNSESVQCNFFIFDHMTFIKFKICCCLQNFIETDDFSLRYGDITIFKMAAVRRLEFWKFSFLIT